MAKIKTTTVENVPCWAADYFVNAETSGLNEEDLALVHEYERKLERQGLRLISPIEDTRNEFCACPAFGKACDTEDWTAEVLPPDRIVFRKYWNKSDKKWTPIAFMPDTEANPGSIMSYEHCGQHAEAAEDWYQRCTKPCEPELYAPLLKELKSIGYRPRIMKRISRREA